MKPTLTLRPGAEDRDDKAKALAAVQRTDMDERMKRLPVDIPETMIRQLHMMRARSVETVPVKSFVIEALDDLFAKYERGQGKYPLVK
jgi:hypothetical protein